MVFCSFAPCFVGHRFNRNEIFTSNQLELKLVIHSTLQNLKFEVKEDFSFLTYVKATSPKLDVFWVNDIRRFCVTLSQSKLNVQNLSAYDVIRGKKLVLTSLRCRHVGVQLCLWWKKVFKIKQAIATSFLSILCLFKVTVRTIHKEPSNLKCLSSKNIVKFLKFNWYWW